MSTALLTVIIYDVPDDKRRTRLHRLLKQYGETVQYSAFEARLTAAERSALLREAGRLLQAERDRLILYPIGKEQERGILLLGDPRPVIELPQYFLV